MNRLPSNEQLWAFALLLQEMHKNDGSERKCDPTAKRDYKGLLGQRRFAYLTGGDVDMSIRRSGDGHIDAIVDMTGDGEAYPPGKYAIDVKSAERPSCLMVARRDMLQIKRPTAFVLASILNYRNEDVMTWDAELVGWEWDAELRKHEPYDRGGYGIISYVAHDDCGEESRGRDIYELLAKIKRQWGRGA